MYTYIATWQDQLFGLSALATLGVVVGAKSYGAGVATVDDVMTLKAQDLTTSLFLEAAQAQLATIQVADVSDEASRMEAVRAITSIVPLVDG